MASNTNTREQDRKELEKYVRFFVIKAVQIIVQARLGQRVFTECKTISAGSDWVSIIALTLISAQALNSHLLDPRNGP